MPALNRNEKVACEYYETQTTKHNLSSHKNVVQMEHFNDSMSKIFTNVQGRFELAHCTETSDSASKKHLKS